MAKRARKTKPAFDPVRTGEPDEEFSAAALRELIARAHEPHKENVDAWFPKFKADVQQSVRDMARLGRTRFILEYDEVALSDACGADKTLEVDQRQALGARLTDAVVASWFPGCQGAKVVVDLFSIDIVVRL